MRAWANGPGRVRLRFLALKARNESGISDPAMIKIFTEAGFKGFLIGETFMKENDPAMAFNIFAKNLFQYQ